MKLPRAPLLCAAMLIGSAAWADEALVTRTRAAYEALKSYADTGTMVVEYGSAGAPIVETHHFTTRLRRPRHYFFDFREDSSAGGERLVIWSDEEAFHTWWSTTGSEAVYPKGRGHQAFALTSAQTRSAAMYLAPLFFPTAGLQGSLAVFSDATKDGEESVSGHPCIRLKGMERMAYQTGHELPPRKMTVWIDAKTYLVRKIMQDTPRGSLPGTVQRIVVTFDPVLQPALEDEQFQFEVPAQD